MSEQRSRQAAQPLFCSRPDAPEGAPAFSPPYAHEASAGEVTRPRCTPTLAPSRCLMPVLHLNQRTQHRVIANQNTKRRREPTQHRPASATSKHDANRRRRGRCVCVPPPARAMRQTGSFCFHGLLNGDLRRLNTSNRGVYHPRGADHSNGENTHKHIHARGQHSAAWPQPSLDLFHPS